VLTPVVDTLAAAVVVRMRQRPNIAVTVALMVVHIVAGVAHVVVVAENVMFRSIRVLRIVRTRRVPL
jgi:hypothetical protein